MEAWTTIGVNAVRRAAQQAELLNKRSAISGLSGIVRWLRWPLAVLNPGPTAVARTTLARRILSGYIETRTSAQ